MKIIVIPDSFSGENLQQSVLADAAASMPPGFDPPAASVERDASGRVVKVNVTLPTGISEGDLATATQKINENPGVAIAAPFPVKRTFDFNEADGTLYQSVKNEVLFSRAKVLTNRLIHDSAQATKQYSAQMQYTLLGLQRVLGYETTFKFKCASASWGTAGGASGNVLAAGIPIFRMWVSGGQWQVASYNPAITVVSNPAFVANTDYTIEAKFAPGSQMLFVDGVLMAYGTNPFSWYPTSLFGISDDGNTWIAGTSIDDLTGRITDGIAL